MPAPRSKKSAFDPKGLLGHVVGGSYRLLRIVGSGGTATVFEAQRVGASLRCAVKLLTPQQDDPRAAERFVQEIDIAKKVQGPSAVEIYGDGALDNGLPYLVMEYLEGEDLAGRLERSGRLPSGDVLRFLEACAQVLERAHAINVLHRDLKPANIFFARSAKGEQVKVLDFGAAKDRSRDSGFTEVGRVVGTPWYMSPEQARGQVLDPRSDQFSLAILAYQALTGQVPFEGNAPHEVLHKIAMDPLPKIRLLAPHLPEAIEPVLARALAKKPADRFPSVTAFVSTFWAAFPAAAENKGGARVASVVVDEALWKEAKPKPTHSPDDELAMMLLAAGLISEPVMEAAQAMAREQGSELADALLRQNALTEDDLLRAMPVPPHWRVVRSEKVRGTTPSAPAVRMLTLEQAERLRVLPFAWTSITRELQIYAAFPAVSKLEAELAEVTSAKKISVFLTTPGAVNAAIRRWYRDEVDAFRQLLPNGAGPTALVRSPAVVPQRPVTGAPAPAPAPAPTPVSAPAPARPQSQPARPIPRSMTPSAPVPRTPLPPMPPLPPRPNTSSNKAVSPTLITSTLGSVAPAPIPQTETNRDDTPGPKPTPPTPTPTQTPTSTPIPPQPPEVTSPNPKLSVPKRSDTEETPQVRPADRTELFRVAIPTSESAPDSAPTVEPVYPITDRSRPTVDDDGAHSNANASGAPAATASPAATHPELAAATGNFQIVVEEPVEVSAPPEPPAPVQVQVQVHAPTPAPAPAPVAAEDVHVDVDLDAADAEPEVAKNAEPDHSVDVDVDEDSGVHAQHALPPPPVHESVTPFGLPTVTTPEMPAVGGITEAHEIDLDADDVDEPPRASTPEASAPEEIEDPDALGIQEESSPLPAPAPAPESGAEAKADSSEKAKNSNLPVSKRPTARDTHAIPSEPSLEVGLDELIRIQSGPTGVEGQANPARATQHSLLAVPSMARRALVRVAEVLGADRVALVLADDEVIAWSEARTLGKPSPESARALLEGHDGVRPFSELPPSAAVDFWAGARSVAALQLHLPDLSKAILVCGRTLPTGADSRNQGRGAEIEERLLDACLRQFEQVLACATSPAHSRLDVDAWVGGERFLGGLAQGDGVHHTGTELRVRGVTAVFIDVRMATEQLREETPARLVAKLNDLFEQVTRVVFAHGGLVERVQGDGLVAVWGTLSDESAASAREALKAATTIALLPAQSGAEAQMTRPRIGVYSGRSVVGSMGPRGRRAYRVIGTVTSAAERLAPLGEPGRVVVSEEALQFAGANVPEGATSLEHLEQGMWSLKAFVLPEC